MKYKFPYITHLDQVRAAIAGKPEFIVAEKDGGYTVVNYMVSTDTTFPPVTEGTDDRIKNAILRECRGIIFDTLTGNILHRRLHKFFNVNEREETLIHNINFSEPHTILAKLDGSMITPVMTDAGLRWGTKMGVTDVALPVEEFVVEHPDYSTFAKLMFTNGVTPIFEWCSRKQKIVVDYPEDSLVLIALRNTKTGTYWAPDCMRRAVSQFDIPVVKEYPGTVDSMQELIKSTESLVDAEGWVVRFESGHMIKIKGEWYVKLHKAKDRIRFEKNIIDLILNEGIDDIKAFLDSADRDRVESYVEKFWSGVFATAKELDELYNSFTALDQRDFAVNFVLKQDKKYHRFLFEMRKGNKAIDVIRNELMNNCSSATEVNTVRWIHKANWTTLEE
jgi:RNA ligase